MPQRVYTLPTNKIQKMKEFYKNELQSTPQGAIFRAKTKNAVITGYKSGKVLFQGSSPEIEVKKWDLGLEKAKHTPKHKQTRAHSFTPPHILYSSSHIGSDEAGTGDYFGPITVACAFVPHDQIQTLKQLGVQDSKNLTDRTIRSIAKDIIKLNIPYALLVLHNEKYNRLQRKGWSQGKMKAMLHHHAINKLLQKINNQPNDGILIDQFCEPAVYQKYLASENESLPSNTYFLTKAESHSIAVAAGSIIARTSFLKEMDKLSAETGMDLPKGASSKVDQVIAKVIKKYGKESLSQIAKVHFANTHKAEKYL
ncbi:ribonuclease HIII [Oceanobacillus halotolerans]|uniref:ribonuclease HIII n=1 Tax=Oceanobacillus halotolerans TaxID=2663380 RepID=UPI0013DCEBD5|nr:ribonuclease HIII [Oceanobacillus halotolerans]